MPAWETRRRRFPRAAAPAPPNRLAHPPPARRPEKSLPTATSHAAGATWPHAPVGQKRDPAGKPAPPMQPDRPHPPSGRWGALPPPCAASQPAAAGWLRTDVPCGPCGKTELQPAAASDLGTGEPTPVAPRHAGTPPFRVPKVGVEPTRVLPHWILSPARLPIPPLRRGRFMIVIEMPLRKIPPRCPRPATRAPPGAPGMVPRPSRNARTA